MILSFDTEKFNLKKAWPNIALVTMIICFVAEVVAFIEDKNYRVLTANLITMVWVLNWYFATKQIQTLENLKDEYAKLLFNILDIAKENTTNKSKD